MNVVDSSGWLEFFGKGTNYAFFLEPILATEELLVPTVCLYEVFKVVAAQRDEDSAQAALAQMLEGLAVDIDTRLAISAARIAVEAKLPMADSLIWATAQAYSATLWTQDRHFKDLPDVKYIEKR
jgi:predicted nucleic acid-binding protein